MARYTIFKVALFLLQFVPSFWILGVSQSATDNQQPLLQFVAHGALLFKAFHKSTAYYHLIVRKGVCKTPKDTVHEARAASQSTH